MLSSGAPSLFWAQNKPLNSLKLRGLLFLGYKQGINKQHYPSFLRAVAAPVGVVWSSNKKVRPNRPGRDERTLSDGDDVGFMMFRLTIWITNNGLKSSVSLSN